MAPKRPASDHISNGALHLGLGVRLEQASWQDLAGEGFDDVLGTDVRRAPLHWLMPKMNKIFNQEVQIAKVIFTCLGPE